MTRRCRSISPNDRSKETLCVDRYIRAKATSDRDSAIAMRLFLSMFVAIVASFGSMVSAGEICFGYLPVYGRMICGPDNVSGYLVADRANFSYIKIWFGLPYGMGSDTADFGGACLIHDNCYDRIDGNGSRDQCLQQFDSCTSQFREDLDNECDRLPRKCQRSKCRTFFRDVYVGAVLTATEIYMKDGFYNCY